MPQLKVTSDWSAMTPGYSATATVTDAEMATIASILLAHPTYGKVRWTTEEMQDTGQVDANGDPILGPATVHHERDATADEAFDAYITANLFDPLFESVNAAVEAAAIEAAVEAAKSNVKKIKPVRP